jgi:Circularly permutated YpsA SLOG family
MAPEGNLRWTDRGGPSRAGSGPTVRHPHWRLDAPWMEDLAGPNPHLGREYGLREHTGDYAERTAANVRDSDGTIRFASSFRTFGELCTMKWITHYGRPHIDIDIRSPRPVIDIVEWMRKHNICVLNVAGNTEPKSRTALASGITAFVTNYLAQLFRQLGHQDTTEGGE